MSRELKHFLIVAFLFFLALLAAAAIVVHKDDLYCLYLYTRCRTWDKDDADYKSAAVEELKKAKSVRLICWMLDDKDADVRGKAAYALTDVSTKEELQRNKAAISMLISILESKDDWSVKSAAAAALGHSGGAEEVKALAKCLLNPSENGFLKLTVVRLLARTESDEGYAALIKYLGNTGRLGSESMMELARAKKPVENLLLEYLGKKDSNQETFPNIFSILNFRKAVKHLILLLGDERQEIRSEAAVHLGLLRDKSALVPLKDALKIEKNEYAKCAIAQAINDIEHPPADSYTPPPP